MIADTLQPSTQWPNPRPTPPSHPLPLLRRDPKGPSARRCSMTRYSSNAITLPLSLSTSTDAKTPSHQWDHAISTLLVRSSLGLSFGVIFSVLLFKRRAWPAWLGLGFGAGRAWEEADGMFTTPPDLSWGNDEEMKRGCMEGKDVVWKYQQIGLKGSWGIGESWANCCTTGMFRRGGMPTGRDGLRMVRS